MGSTSSSGRHRWSTKRSAADSDTDAPVWRRSDYRLDDAFFAAVKLNDVRTVRAILESAADSTSHCTYEPARAFRYIKPVNFPEFLRRYKVDVDSRNEDKHTALMLAAALANGVEMAALLLDHGADMNACATDRTTALHRAAGSGMVKLLIERGADISAMSNRDDTPLLLAAREDRVEVANALIEHGANIYARTPFGETAVFAASVSMLEVLVKRGVSVLVTSNYGMTPMHRAATRSVDEVAFLLDHGAPLDALSKSKETPLVYAASCGKRDIAEFLLDKRASVHGGGDPPFEHMPIVAAALSGHLDVVAYLLSRGASFKPSDTKHTDGSSDDSGSALSPRLLNRVEVLDAMIQHLDVIDTRTPTVSLNFWSWRRSFDSTLWEAAPKNAELLWRFLERKLLHIDDAMAYQWRYAGDARSKQHEFGEILLKSWRWALEFEERHNQEQSGTAAPISSICVTQYDLDIVFSLEEALEKLRVAWGLPDWEDACSPLNTDDEAWRTQVTSCSQPVRFMNALIAGPEVVKQLVVDEIARSCCCWEDSRERWSHLHLAALALTDLHKSYTYKARREIASSRAAVAIAATAASAAAPVSNEIAALADADASSRSPGVDLTATPPSAPCTAAESEIVRWSSPEFLQRSTSPGQTPAMCKTDDVYEFGMCIVEASSGHVPWANASLEVVRVLKNLGRLPQRPERLSADDQWNLVQGMCARDPKKRPVMAAIVRQLEKFARRERADPSHT